MTGKLHQKAELRVFQHRVEGWIAIRDGKDQEQPGLYLSCDVVRESKELGDWNRRWILRLPA